MSKARDHSDSPSSSQPKIMEVYFKNWVSLICMKKYLIKFDIFVSICLFTLSDAKLFQYH